MATVAVASSWRDMLAGVILESKRVVAAHSRHFLALTVLFLLPLSSLLVAAPSLLPFSPFSTLHPHPLPPPRSLLRLHHHLPSASPADAALALAYAAAALLLALLAATTIAGSVHRGFFGRPVKLLPALRSFPGPLVRLLLTLLASILPLTAVLLLLSSLFLLSLRTLSILHLPHSHRAAPFTCFIFAAITILSIIYFLLNWSLAGAIAVMESSWGFEPLRRSAHLVQGMRWAALCLYLFFVTGIGVMLWGFSLWRPGETAGDWSKVLPVVARTVFGSGITAVLLLYGLVTNVVLYMYCKALHGELAGEIAEEFAWQYVSLPFDDRKVPHVVSVIRQ